MSGSNVERGGDDMTKARLMYLLVFAALLVASVAGWGCFFRPLGMNDGGWIN